MLNTFRALLILLFVTLMPALAEAVVMDSLFESEVPVATQSAEERDQAIPKAFKQVLIKVSGNSTINTVGVVGNHLARAKTLMQQYSYRTGQATDGHEQLTLKVGFDPKGVNELLKQAGQAVWGNNRPSVLAWIVVDDKKGRQIIGSGTDSWIPAWISEAADARGLPMILPVMDLEDISRITTNDLWIPYTDNVLGASKRYASDAVLIGKVEQLSNDRWRGQWKILVGDEHIDWDNAATTTDQVINQSVNELADLLASRYAVLNSVHTENHLLLTVRSVRNVNDYARAINYLKGLAPVSSVQVRRVDAQDIEFDLKVVGGEQTLIQAISLNRVLRPSARTDYAAMDAPVLQYELVQ